MSGVVLYRSPPFLRLGLSLTDLGRLAGQRALGSHLSSISPTRGLEALPCLDLFFPPMGIRV